MNQAHKKTLREAATHYSYDFSQTRAALLKDITFTNQLVELTLFCEELTIKNCFSAHGFKLIGHVERINVVDSSISFIDSDLCCRELTITNSSPDDLHQYLEINDSNISNLESITIGEKTVLSYASVLNDLIVNGKIFIDTHSELDLHASQAKCQRLVLGKNSALRFADDISDKYKNLAKKLVHPLCAIDAENVTSETSSKIYYSGKGFSINGVTSCSMAQDAKGSIFSFNNLKRSTIHTLSVIKESEKSAM